MKKVGWLAFSALLFVGLIMLAYRAGYTTGSDMAKRENRAEVAE